MWPTRQLRSRVAISLQLIVWMHFSAFAHTHTHIYIHTCVLFSQLHATFTLTIHRSFAARQAMQGMQLHFAYAPNYARTFISTRMHVCTYVYAYLHRCTCWLEVVLLCCREPSCSLPTTVWQCKCNYKYALVACHIFNCARSYGELYVAALR